MRKGLGLRGRITGSMEHSGSAYSDVRDCGPEGVCAAVLEYVKYDSVHDNFRARVPGGKRSC